MKLAEGDSAANFIGPNSAPLCARAKRAREWKTGARSRNSGDRLTDRIFSSVGPVKSAALVPGGPR